MKQALPTLYNCINLPPRTMCLLKSDRCVFFAFFLAFGCVLVSAFTPNRKAVTITSVTTQTSTTGNHNKTGILNHNSVGRGSDAASTAAPHAASADDDDASQDEAEDDDDEEEEDENEDEEETADDSSESNGTEEDKKCTCSGSNCSCCVNLNLSFIDLGSPGCVKFRYMSDNDTLAVNMSYGGRLLESDTLKRASSKPTCMDLLSDLAQVCAKFTGVTKVSRGVKGCITIESSLLGVSQTNYEAGCFNMDIEGIQPQPHAASKPVISSNSTKESTTDENEEEELATAISQSAAEGFSWFNNFISSVFSEETSEAVSDSVQPHYNRTSSSKVKSK